MTPLKCCWVWTYWKVEGQTITEKFIYNPGNRETDHGILYVMFSRVRCFSDIGLPEGILVNRLKKINKYKLFGPRLKFEEKLD